VKIEAKERRPGRLKARISIGRQFGCCPAPRDATRLSRRLRISLLLDTHVLLRWLADDFRLARWAGELKGTVSSSPRCRPDTASSRPTSAPPRRPLRQVLVAQAQLEGRTLVTRDPALGACDV